MLQNFFELDGVGHPTFDHAQFLTTLSQGRNVGNFILDAASPVPGKHGIVDKVFTNANFSHCHFKELTFRDCEFIDCLFKGAEFEECVFQRCKFTDCNTYRIKVKNTRIDPRIFTFDKTYRVTAANVATDLYQQLFKNAGETHHPEFAAIADVERRRWMRRDFKWELRRHKPLAVKPYLTLFLDHTYETTAKYGYGPARFLCFSFLLVMGSAYGTKLIWPYFKMKSENGAEVSEVTYIDAIYNCLLLMTTLGLGNVSPGNLVGKLYVIGTALFGVAWFSLFTAILVRRVLR